jgi:hypothetical protein
MTTASAVFRAARDELIELRGQHTLAVEKFRWPKLAGPFNSATDAQSGGVGRFPDLDHAPVEVPGNSPWRYLRFSPGVAWSCGTTSCRGAWPRSRPLRRQGQPGEPDWPLAMVRIAIGVLIAVPHSRNHTTPGHVRHRLPVGDAMANRSMPSRSLARPNSRSRSRSSRRSDAVDLQPEQATPGPSVREAGLVDDASSQHYDTTRN